MEQQRNSGMLYQSCCISTMATLVIFMLLSPILSATAAVNTASTSSYIIPSVKFSDLKSISTQQKQSTPDNTLNILMDSLTSTGIIAITGIDEGGEYGFSKTRRNALHGLCDCIIMEDSSSNQQHNDNFVSLIDNTDTSFLDDGLTTRTSIATTTIKDGKPLPLPGEQLDSVCKSHSSTPISEEMENLRDYIHTVSQEFIRVLDQMVALDAHDHSRGFSYPEDNNELMRSIHGKSYKTFDSIINDANHLEHFHVYSKKNATPTIHSDEEFNKEGAVDTALTAHTDVGLFLSFIPAVSCLNQKEDEDSSFFISIDGQLQNVVFPSQDTIVIMLGVGAQHWIKINNMPQGLSLRATKHAVHMKGGTSRAWYGMMHLVPENSIIQEFVDNDNKRHLSTFADMRQSMVIRSPKRTFSSKTNQTDHDSILIGCGLDDKDYGPTPSGNVELTSQKRRRRRLEMVSDASVCNNVTNFYCWMSCLDIPDSNNLDRHLDRGESLYCADYSKLTINGDSDNLEDEVASAVTSCTDPSSGIPGGNMNTNCIGIWRTTIETVPSQNFDVVSEVETTDPVDVQENSNEHTNEDHSTHSNNDDHSMHSSMANDNSPFCYGGTSMFMNGFQWNSLICVIYLFPSWVLDTQAKLIGACFGTIIMGISVEGIIYCRKLAITKLSSQKNNNDHNTRMILSKTQTLAISTVIYGLQLSTGYMLMLVIMTYSGPLFVCTIIGLMSGHFYFQWLNIQKSKQKSCCSSSNNQKDCEGNSCNKTCPSRDAELNIPEGFTPCCQNDLTEEAENRNSSDVS